MAQLRPSGAETMLYCAAEEFRKHGVQGAILATSVQGCGPFAESLGRAGYEIHYLPFDRRPGFFLRLYRLIRSGQYDVVHTHWDGANLYTLAVARLAGVSRLVSTVHSTFMFDGWLRARRAAHRFITSRIIGTRRIAISESVKANEWSRFRSRTEVIANWYDSKRFRPPTAEERRKARDRYGLTDKQFAIVTVGNCSWIKHHDLLLESLASLSDDKNWVYLHAGEEDEHGSERAIATKLGISDRVRFLGGEPDIVPLLHAADAFVMPSRYEGFGIAAIEALASAVPTLLARVPGLWDFERVYPHIRYFEPSPEACSEELRRLMAMDAATRRSYAADHASISRERFSIEAGVGQYVALYRS